MKNLIKQKIIDIGKFMVSNSLVVGTWGNISCKIGNNLIAITPSGVDYNSITIDDIAVLDFSGKQIEGNLKPSIEWRVHLKIYQKRGDIKSILHTHSKSASTFSAARKPIPPIVEDLVQIVGGEVPVAKYSLPGTEQLGLNIAEKLKDRDGVLLANHGVIGVGKTLKECLKICSIIEKGAYIALMAQLIGGAIPIPKDDVEKMRDFYINSYGQKENL